MSGGDAIVRSLLAQGVDTVFALPGVQIYGLFDALARAGSAIRVICPRHEQAAAYMAFGYAKSTGGRGLRGRAGSGRAELDRGAVLRLRDEHAGGVPDRPGALRVHRRRQGASARAARPARDAADADEVGGADRAIRPTAPGARGRGLSPGHERTARGRSRSRCRGRCSTSTAEVSLLGAERPRRPAADRRSDARARGAAPRTARATR